MTAPSLATATDALRALAKQLTKVKGIPRAADVLTDLRHVIDNRATGGWGSDTTRRHRGRA